jgi:hypothetical protein
VPQLPEGWRESGLQRLRSGRQLCFFVAKPMRATVFGTKSCRPVGRQLFVLAEGAYSPTVVPNGTRRADQQLAGDLPACAAGIVHELDLPFAGLGHINDTVGLRPDRVLLGTRLGNDALGGDAGRHRLTTELAAIHKESRRFPCRVAHVRRALEITVWNVQMGANHGGGRARPVGKRIGTMVSRSGNHRVAHARRYRLLHVSLHGYHRLSSVRRTSGS